AISAGNNHTCARIADGTARCWGANTFGQLGDDSTTSRPMPVTVIKLGVPLPSVVAIAAGGNHTCALISNSLPQCWGLNTFGQLGDGTTSPSETPVSVSGLNFALSIAAGTSHTCAVVESGVARCWGANAVGQLGDQTTNNSSVPTTVSGGSVGISARAI